MKQVKTRPWYQGNAFNAVLGGIAVLIVVGNARHPGSLNWWLLMAAGALFSVVGVIVMFFYYKVDKARSAAAQQSEQEEAPPPEAPLPTISTP